MTAPLVTKLLSERSACQDPVRRAEITAHLACYYARTGDFDQAAILTAELRSTFGAGGHPRVSVLIMLIEALRHYFADQNPLAVDRLKRACLISNVIRDRELIALTESWMSYLQFNRGDYVQYGQTLARAFGHLDEENQGAKCRLAITLGDAFLLTNDSVSSRAWYAEARDAAVKTGDQAAIGAITYNRAAFHVHVIRTSQAVSFSSDTDPKLALAEVESAISYQRIAALTSLDHLLFIARISALIVQKQFDLARTLTEQLLGSIGLPLNPAERTMLAFDHALCLHHLDDVTALRGLFESAEYLDACHALDPNDRLIVFGTLSQLGFDSLGDASQIVIAEALAAAKEDYDRECGRLTEAIRPYARS